MSQEEKRQLILAHAARHRPLDPVQRLSLWAGVVICLLFVVGAWAYTVGSGIRRSMARPMDENLNAVLEAAREFTQTETDPASRDENGLTYQLRNMSARLQVMSEQEKMLNEIAARLAASSTAAGPASATGTERNDLFQAAVTTTKNAQSKTDN